MEGISRRGQIVELRKAGLSYRQIGRRLGISGERVRQIINPKKPTKKPRLQARPHLQAMLKTSDVAQLLGLYPNTVRRWAKSGALKSYRIGPRGDRRFRREDVDSFLKEDM